MLQQSSRCSFDQIQHLLKSVGPTVVRVGHFRRIRFGCELEEQANAVAHSGRGALLKGSEVLPIHCEDQIKPMKVLCLDRPRAQRRHIVATTQRCLARACVWRRTDVVRGRPGGGDFECQIRRFAGRNLAKYDFRGRRAADVPQADEQDLHGETRYYLTL